MQEAGFSAVNQILFLKILKRSGFRLETGRLLNERMGHTSNECREVKVVRTPEIEGEFVHIELEFRLDNLNIESMLSNKLTTKLLCFVFVASLSHV